MKICDSHTDILTEIKNKKERENYVKNIKNKIETVSCAVFTTNSTITIKDVENFKYELDCYNKKHKTKLMLSIEDLGFVKTKEDLKHLIKLKPVSVTLTWNYKNQYAGGAHTNKCLTKLGIEIIKELEDNNILIDTAHLSRKAFYEFSKITTKPIYNSHCNVNSIYKHKRNLTNKQIKTIVDSGGFVGITIYQNFISDGKISAKDVASQFDYLIKKFGSDYFGLGTDLFGFEEKFLPTDFNGYGNVGNLVNELKKLNYSKNTIKKIINKNYKKFIKNIKNN